MLTPVQQQEIIRDTRQYLDQANPQYGQAHNIALAKPLVERWEGQFLWICFVLTGESLREMWNAPLLRPRVALWLIDRMSVLHDITSAFDSYAISALSAVLQASSEEDVHALVGVVIASPNFAHPILRGVLQTRFATTESTSCKIALALALHQCGDPAQFSSVASSGYLYDYEPDARGMGKSEEEIRILVGMMNAPRVVEILAFDIASNGAVYDGRMGTYQNLPWKRKQYTD